MANYFYKWTPLFVLGTVLLLGLPWLGLIALVVVVLVLVSAVATLAFGVAWAIGTVSRAITRRWHGRTALGHGMAPALSHVSSSSAGPTTAEDRLT
jgi:hypothetical protein